MHGPETSRSPVPNVTLILVVASSLWVGIYLSASGLWPRRPAAPAVPMETRATQLANAPVRARAKSVRRVKVAKFRRKGWSRRSLAARTFAANPMY
jgi:hypothetical protein